MDGAASTMSLGCNRYEVFDINELGTVIVEGSSVQNISYPFFLEAAHGVSLYPGSGRKG